MTFAGVYRAPVILNIVNNQWAISSFAGIAGGELTTFAARASATALPGLRVDGNDPWPSMPRPSGRPSARAPTSAPTLIEMFTYRVEGHSTSDDPSAYRPPEAGKAWPLGDPIERLKQHLIALGEWDEERHEALAKALATRSAPRRRRPRRSARWASTIDFPQDVTTMFEDVFETMPWHLRRAAAQMVPSWRRSAAMTVMNMIQAINSRP